MERRHFLKSAAVAAGLATLPGLASASVMTPAKGEKIPKGPVTLYMEFHIGMPLKEKMIRGVEKYSEELSKKKGFLSLSLKNMIGDSTMVKNYPSNLKGVLHTAYFDAAKEGSMPLFYALFVRFKSYEDMQKSGVNAWFSKQIKTHAPASMKYFEGVFVTVAAGDREHIYKERKEIERFLSHQVDHRSEDYLTVNNHVTIESKNTEIFNKKSTTLLTVAQNTFRPAKGDADFNPKFPKGMPGSYQTTHYRKAVTTEILQSAFSDGKYRRYLFHGTWESLYDHENSHMDPRFRKGVSGLFPYLTDLPVEPFYETIVLKNKKA